VTVTDDESLETARQLMKVEGISAGISCGAAMAATLKIAARPEYQGKTIVTILPDFGERYLSTALFDGIIDSAAKATITVTPTPGPYDVSDE